MLFTPQGCTVTAVSESLQAFDLLFGILGRLCFLGLLGFCCPLLRGFLRALLVGCLGLGLCTTGLALRALSVVFTYASTATLLAIIAPPVVMAYARATTLLAL